MKVSKVMLCGLTAGFLFTCVACTGRRADTMVPLGETVEVVIPEGDVIEDSAVAAGDTGSDTVLVTSDQVIL